MEDNQFDFEVISQVTGTLTRRKVRNLLLRTRGGFELNEQDKPLAHAILNIFEEQIKGFFTLEDFTDKWDIHPNNPLKVITPFQWEECGGLFDVVTGMRTPAAFTHQAI